MTQRERRRFIRELVHTVQDGLLKDVPKMPEEWDGMELRELVAERFQRATGWLQKNRIRYQDYKNTVLINNL